MSLPPPDPYAWSHEDHLRFQAQQLQALDAIRDRYAEAARTGRDPGYVPPQMAAWRVTCEPPLPPGLDPNRLRFVRWLVQRGSISEG